MKNSQESEPTTEVWYISKPNSYGGRVVWSGSTKVAKFEILSGFVVLTNTWEKKYPFLPFFF